MRWIPLFLASMKLQCNCGVAQIWILLSVFNRFTREAAWGFTKRLDEASCDGLDHLVMVKDAETTRCFAWNFIAPPCQGPNRRPSPGDLENLIAPLDSACCPVSHDEFPVFGSFASPICWRTHHSWTLAWTACPWYAGVLVIWKLQRYRLYCITIRGMLRWRWYAWHHYHF